MFGLGCILVWFGVLVGLGFWVFVMIGCWVDVWFWVGLGWVGGGVGFVGGVWVGWGGVFWVLSVLLDFVGWFGVV